MSATATAIKGNVILLATMEATPQAAAKIELALKKIREFCLTDAEPGCLVYRVNRFETKFAVFEEYVDSDAADFHLKQKAFLEFFELVKSGDNFTLAPQIAFYKEVA